MRILPLGWAAALVLLGGAASPPASATAGMAVVPGYDMFHTLDGTQLAVDLGAGVTLVRFASLAPGRFDFGAGQVDTWGADTVVRRFATATPAHGRTPVELVSLGLTSTSPAGFYVTLQSDRGRNALDPPDGVRSLGTLDIAFDPDGLGGTFASTFLVSYDVRNGSPTGPIVYSGTALLQGEDRWQHAPAQEPTRFCHAGPAHLHCVGVDPDAREVCDELVINGQGTEQCLVLPAVPLIPGVNYRLNGTDDTADFNPLGS